MGSFVASASSPQEPSRSRDWPGGKYWAGPHIKCETCGATGYLRPKYAPPYCGPCWEERMREAEWQRAKWEADMRAEYGPYLPKPSPFRLADAHSKSPSRPAMPKEEDSHG